MHPCIYFQKDLRGVPHRCDFETTCWSLLQFEAAQAADTDVGAVGVEVGTEADTGAGTVVCTEAEAEAEAGAEAGAEAEAWLLHGTS